MSVLNCEKRTTPVCCRPLLPHSSACSRAQLRHKLERSIVSESTQGPTYLRKFASAGRAEGARGRGAQFPDALVQIRFTRPPPPPSDDNLGPVAPLALRSLHKHAGVAGNSRRNGGVGRCTRASPCSPQPLVPLRRRAREETRGSIVHQPA
ncbi:hypothetical protein BD413DRAFT_86058 [Trametes elegans]|nr:hypothetical protein BD413DRAFT_86058 [Trametes elegans]